MTHHKLLLFIIFSSVLSASAQNPELIEARGASYIPLERMSMPLAQAQAIKMAKVNALESIFGEKIFDTDLLNIRNTNSDGRVLTRTDYQKISRSFIAGHWVKDITPPDIKVRVDSLRNEVWIAATVHGQVRKLRSPPYEVQANALNCNQPQCIKNTFRQNDRLYAFFKSQVDGYLTIYLNVRAEGIVQRFLPFDNQEAFPIKANEEYIFFDKIGPGIQLVIENENPSIKGEIEVDGLYFVFSTKKFYQPAQASSARKDEALSADLSLMLPPEVPRTTFEEWLAKLKLWENVKVIKQIIEIRE